MDLAIITACVFPNRKPIWRLEHTCKKFGLTLFPYGEDDPTYRGWVDIKIYRLLAALKQRKAEGFSHVLYTDGRDSFFLASHQRIIAAYRNLRLPRCLFAVEPKAYPRPDLPPLGSGQFIGEIDYLIELWEFLIGRYAGKDTDQNEQGWMQECLVSEPLWEDVRLDYNSRIFYSCGNPPIQADLLSCVHERMLLLDNYSFPCAIHFNSGYTDPVNGKDAVMQPLWDALGFGGPDDLA